MENWEAGEGEGNYYTLFQLREPSKASTSLGKIGFWEVWNQTYMVLVFRYYIYITPGHITNDVQPPGPVPTRSLIKKNLVEYKVERKGREKKRERKRMSGEGS